ncbi:unnamed protein product [Dovyalis caffra]|uniref:Uncharacterized protein n=1 Tax=Dovyalis caffra TaxID=77055 RepID=A0AAV1S5U9_9ROSI|nr:unnamed protein product [Dovyalis caffra]
MEYAIRTVLDSATLRTTLQVARPVSKKSLILPLLDVIGYLWLQYLHELKQNFPDMCPWKWWVR